MSSLLKRWHHQLQMLADLPDAISEFLHVLHQVEVLNLPTITRFNITENVATLAPDLPTSCSGCGSVCAETVQQFERQSKIILTNLVVDAKGM